HRERVDRGRARGRLERGRSWVAEGGALLALPRGGRKLIAKPWRPWTEGTRRKRAPVHHAIPADDDRVDISHGGLPGQVAEIRDSFVRRRIHAILEQP